MSTSYYSEVELVNNRDIPPDLEQLQGKLSREFASTNNSGFFDDDCSVDEAYENSLRERSHLQKWSELPLTATNGPPRAMESFKKAHEFYIYGTLDELVKDLMKSTVVLLIAPTGAGKSVLAPFIAEKLALSSGSDGGGSARKTMMVVPTVQHCGATSSKFCELFRDSGIKISAYNNPYESRGDSKLPAKNVEFVYTTYNSAMRVLPHAKLNLLILDEVHESNDNVQVTMAMALKMLKSASFFRNQRSPARSLNKLLLMTATMEKEQIKAYERYFRTKNISFKVLDLSDRLYRNKTLTMSCLNGTTLPQMFEKTTLSDNISREFFAKGHAELTLDGRNQDLCDQMECVLNCVMEMAWEILNEKLRNRSRNYDMQSIIDHPAFHPVRYDESITRECTRKGAWLPQGHQGRIVCTTNLVAAGLTIPNAAYVIDSGLAKVPTEYSRDGLRKLETKLIDKTMLIQRAGRTGRTTDGEYFLPYSTEKVQEIIDSNLYEELLNRDFSEKHYLFMTKFDLSLLHEPPRRLLKELQTSMEIRGLFKSGNVIPKDVRLMASLFNFLPIEFARLIVQAVRLGITAHVVLLVANSLSRVKFCRAGTIGITPIRSWKRKSALHVFCEEMDSKRDGELPLPKSYAGVGDSIALADMLASFFQVVRKKENGSDLDTLKIHDCNFWGGKLSQSDDTMPLTDLYATFVRHEGRGAVCAYKDQCERAIRGVLREFIPEKANIFDRRLNRHVVSMETFCLDEEGRALLSALLTAHSSRVGKMVNGRSIDQSVDYEIYRDKPEGRPVELLIPESKYSQPSGTESEQKKIYGRFHEAFERGGKYSGPIDPITLKQLCFFLNINGEVNVPYEDIESSVTFELNASTGESGIMVKTDRSTCENMSHLRFTLKRALMMLTHTKSEELVVQIKQFIIKLWRECEKTEKDPPELPYSRGYSSRSTQVVQDSSIDTILSSGPAQANIVRARPRGFTFAGLGNGQVFRDGFSKRETSGPAAAFPGEGRTAGGR